MKIGLFFGSFNPIHIGHLIIANHILNETELQRIWFVVSPQNPLKPSQSLLNEYDRFHFVQKAVEENNKMRAIDIEFYLPKPSYTVHTLAYLQEKYPAYYFKIIMGSDSFQNLNKWKNFETIIANYPIIIFKRPGFEIEKKLNAQIEILQAPLLEISATHIRALLREGKSIKYLVPEKVEEEIVANRFFKKNQNK
jgi:nicotinate-nucleotide adenylyltransferase